jgi:DNA-binding NarL/FixJ family response regulator
MRLLVVDDDFTSRNGMVHSLRMLHPQADVREACSLADAVAAVERPEIIDLVLLDLTLPDSRGLPTLRSINEACLAAAHSPRVIVVSAAADYDPSLMYQALDEHATGFFAKGMSFTEFRVAIDLTLAGQIYMPTKHLPIAGAARSKGVRLTCREAEVARLIGRGLPYKRIAQMLSTEAQAMSDSTVRVHTQRIAWKLSVADQSFSKIPAKAAVLIAIAAKVIDVPSTHSDATQPVA